MKRHDRDKWFAPPNSLKDIKVYWFHYVVVTKTHLTFGVNIHKLFFLVGYRSKTVQTVSLETYLMI